jgi:cellulose synthase/poly-beta-1,6-N-acetylglucosamine synthase-like glycosyltransferase
MSGRVSVVVPTYRRPDLLRRCLAALLAQDLPPADYEVIVADDGASPGTRRVVEELATPAGPRLRYLAVNGRHGPAAARNLGWRAAAGEIIAFTDDDTIPDRDWLSKGLESFADDVAGVWGRIVMPLPPSPTDYERNESGLEKAEAVTANCFYRRAALEAVGGFDERFTTAWREDSDLYFTLLERGCRIIHAPKATVVHPVRPTSWGVSLRQQRKSQFNALLYKKHPTLYRRKVQAVPPWDYYLTVAALVLVPVGFAVSQLALVVLGGSVWLGLTGLFCARRLSGTSHAPRHVAEMIVTSALIPPLSVFWRLCGALKFRVLFF